MRRSRDEAVSGLLRFSEFKCLHENSRGPVSERVRPAEERSRTDEGLYRCWR
jgi:hypothetical protein